MKKIQIYDQYSPVFDADGETLLHPSSGYTIHVNTVATQEEANAIVTELYEEAKSLSSTYTDKIVRLNEGYAELLIDFPDLKRLNKVIYTTDV
jgi:ribulose-5-phosphate 4-epimerase/fuculose-1-phosphate aldolase